MVFSGLGLFRINKGIADMKILFAIHALSGGGAERQLSYLSERLANKGLRLLVLYRDLGPSGEASLVRGVDYYKINLHGNYNPLIFKEVYRVIESFEPDLVQTWTNQFDVIVGIIRWFSSFKWVSREASAGSNHSGMKNKILREWLLKKSDVVVANSPGGFNYWNGLHRAKLIMNGFPETGVHSPDPGLEERVGCEPYLLFVGRLVDNKNVDVLIESFAISNAKNVCKLVVCGVGPLENKLKALVVERGVSGNVEFLGYLAKDKVDLLMKGAKALCLLSGHEGMPNVVFEAMLHGVPVVLSSTSTHRALFAEATVIYVNSSDLCDVAKGIDNALIGLPNKRMLAAASKFASECSIDAMTKKYLGLYEDLLAD